MSRHFRLKLLIAAMGLAAAGVAQAATEQRLTAQNLNATPVARLSAQLGLDANSALVEKNSAPTVNGTRTVRMQQTYMGVPVYGRSLAVEQDAQGNALRATGAVVQNLSQDLASVTPKLDAAHALVLLQRRSALTLAGKIENPHADLYVYPQEQGPTRLVYLVSYFVAGDTPTRPTAFIDANTAK
jgi:vibriolysin